MLPKPMPASGPIKQTTSPMVTGGSVVALKYAGGVMVGADTLASYGSLARFDGVTRMAAVGVHKDVIVAAGGDHSDYQFILKMIQQKETEDFVMDDGATMPPSALHSWLTRVMYQRRSKVDPLWNNVIIAGYRDGAAYLGACDLYGTQYEEDFTASGLGRHLAMPILRKAWREDMPEAEARALLEECMRVLFYRDTRASAQATVGKVDASGGTVRPPSLPSPHRRREHSPPSPADADLLSAFTRAGLRAVHARDVLGAPSVRARQHRNRPGLVVETGRLPPLSVGRNGVFPVAPER